MINSKTVTPKKPKAFFRKIEPMLYIGPAYLVMIVVVIFPLGYALWLSFHRWTLRTFQTDVPFIGFENYRSLLSNSDFHKSLLTTLTFVILAIAFELIIGTGLALLLNHEIKGKNIFRSLILLPMMCTNVVVGLTWRLLLNYQYGIVNYYLTQINLPAIQWLSSPRFAMPSAILVDVWNTSSFVALMVLAGLQALPVEPFEAAKIDGASGIQTFFYITLPLLKPYILVALIWRFIDTFRIYDVIYLLTGGGPGKSTETISIFVYRYGFSTFDLGVASAASFIMLAIMLVIAGLLARAIQIQNN